MELNKVIEIGNDVINSSNKDLVDARDFLIGEFDKTKEIIIELTKQLESIELLYNNVNGELNKRYK
jgi:rRNA processing protein Krr1/Pno1